MPLSAALARPSDSPRVLDHQNKQVGTIVTMPKPKGDGRFVVDVASVSACSQSACSQTSTARSQQLVSVKADNLKLGVGSRNAVENTTGFVRTWWNADEKATFVKRNTDWCLDADPEGMRKCNNDIWLYLREKLEQRLKSKARKGNGAAAWEWVRFFGDPTTKPFCCAMYTEAGWGESFQMKPLAKPGVYNEPECTWWPCLAVPPAATCSTPDKVATYCPGLAFPNARPWYAHNDRIIWLDLDNVCGDGWQWVNFGDLGLQPEGPVETPGPVIEELPDSGDEVPDSVEPPGPVIRRWGLTRR